MDTAADNSRTFYGISPFPAGPGTRLWRGDAHPRIRGASLRLLSVVLRAPARSDRRFSVEELAELVLRQRLRRSGGRIRPSGRVLSILYSVRQRSHAVLSAPSRKYSDIAHTDEVGRAIRLPSPAACVTDVASCARPHSGRRIVCRTCCGSVSVSLRVRTKPRVGPIRSGPRGRPPRTPILRPPGSSPICSPDAHRRST